MRSSLARYAVLAVGVAGAGGLARGQEREVPALPFSARAELGTSGKPVGVLLHDFDGDGRALLVAATADPGTLHYWTDPLAEPRVISVPDYPLGPVLLRLATLDALAIASRESDEMLVYAPTAQDAAEPLHRIAVGGRPHALGAGPLLAAETPSVVVATLSGELVVIDHRGTARYPLVEGIPTFVAVEPGRVIVGSQEDRSVRTYLLQPDGSLLPAEERLKLPGIPRDYLSVATETGPECWIAGGDASLWRTSGFDTRARSGLREKRLGTVPLDLEPLTRPDVLQAAQGASSDVVVLCARDLTYMVLAEGRPRHRGPAGQDPWGLACGDMDGDGAVDIALANRGARRVGLILGAPDGSFHEAGRVAVGRGPHSLASGDLDGDGRAEVFVIDAMDQELVVLSGSGADLQVSARYPASPAGDALAAADVDGDGSLDVAFLVRAADGAYLRVLYGDGRGQLAQRAAAPDLACGASVGDLWLGDLNGDGTCEALVTDPARGAVRLVECGAPGLAVAHVLSVPTSPRALGVVDGRIFVALAEPGPRLGVAELAAVGAAGARELVEHAYLDVGLAVADLCALRDVAASTWDLALLARPPGDGAGWVVRLSEIEGTWRERARAATGLRPYAIDAGDFDGDGRADLVVGAQNSHHVNVWRGAEGGLERSPDLGAGRGVLDVILVALQPGGPTTLVVANAFSNDLSLIRAR